MFLDGLMQIGWAEEHYMSSSSSTDYDDNDVSVIMQPSPLNTSYTSSDANYSSKRNTDNSNDEDNDIVSTDNKNADSRTDVDIDIDIDISGENNNNNHSTVENGIGDDKYSWSYDGYRQVKWYNGKSIIYGPQTKIIWKIGDVIGCLLELSDHDDVAVAVDEGDIDNNGDNAIAGDDNKSKIVVGIDEVNNKIITTETIVDDINISSKSDDIVNTIKVTMTYYVNGISYGIAHQFYMQNKYYHHQQQQQPFSFFPALSIENNETIALNLGELIITDSHFLILHLHIDSYLIICYMYISYIN